MVLGGLRSNLLGDGRRRRLTRLSAALVVVLAVLAGCSDDDTSADSGDDTTATTTTTQPPATDEASHEVIEDLVLEATSLADELFQDPTLVEDESDALDRLREIYTDDSPTPEGVEESVRGLAERGESYTPAASGIYREVSIYKWDPATDDDTLTFDTCSLIDRVKVDADGNVLSTEARVIFTAGEAQRVDGVWRFYGLSSDVSRSTEFESGTADPGFCQQIPDESEGDGA
jgi:hypothetical protein